MEFSHTFTIFPRKAEAYLPYDIHDHGKSKPLTYGENFKDSFPLTQSFYFAEIRLPRLKEPRTNFVWGIVTVISFSHNNRASLRIASWAQRRCFISMTAAAGLAIARTFLARLPRRRIHGTRVVALRLSPTVGTEHLIAVNLYQLVKPFPTVFAFVL